MTADLFFRRAALLLICWWLLPLVAVLSWAGDLGSKYRLTLRRNLELCFETMRGEWSRP